MAMMAEKLQTAKPLLPLPSPSNLPSQRPSKFRIFLIRSFHTLFALGLLYSFASWYFRPTFQFQFLSSDITSWPDFENPRINCGRHGILNGKCAENIFLGVPEEGSAIAASRAYATLPHLAGSDQDLVTAKYILNLLQTNFGIEPPSTVPIFPAGSPESRNATLNIPQTTKPRAWIDTYYPVLNTPLDRTLEILDDNGDVVWSADLEEDGDALDEDAANARTAVPVFHGLSKDGDVTGEIFYANYGRQKDYDEVEKTGVNITGKIALVRYGGIFRGLKIKGAQERGAVGTLIYSDPRDDGSVTVENGYGPYPHGPARNPTSVQRGSVQFISSYPGDPTTPGYPAYENSTRTEGTNIPKIPSLPISWSTAQTLFHEMGETGQGRRVRLVNKVDNKVSPIWNTMAVIPGHIKNEVVVVGNHRDAWVLGAADPSSGTTTMHEIIRGLGVLYRKGWRPLRTIVLASWDAEEYGLVGSTEWGEDFPSWIADHVVAYMNVDVSVSGSRFSVSGSPSLAHMLKQAALDIPHPTKENRTLWDATADKGDLIGPADPDVVALADVEEKASRTRLGVTPLGSGSDFTVFLQRLGIASSSIGFSSTLSDPVYHYHSIYDSERFQELYADPGFYRHVAVSKYLGLATLRLADSIVLPVNTTYYSEELISYVHKIEETAKNLDMELNLLPLRHAIGKLYKASLALDKEKAVAEKKLKHIIKKLRHRHRGRHGYRCGSRWRKYSRWIKRVFGVVDEGEHNQDEPRVPLALNAHSRRGTHDNHPPPYPSPHRLHKPPPDHHHHRHWRKLIKAVKRVQRVNKRLSSFEGGFISKNGIVDREWYKHLGVAPGKWLGYGATTLPGIAEALTIEKNSTLAKYEADRLTGLLKKLAKSIAV